LINQNLVGSPVPLTGYYEFCGRAFFHIQDVGYAGAIPLIQADVDQFKS
jgi:hypothetical protein